MLNNTSILDIYFFLPSSQLQLLCSSDTLLQTLWAPALSISHSYCYQGPRGDNAGSLSKANVYNIHSFALA